MNLFNGLAAGNWTIGTGDPTVMGWLTTIAYFVVVALCHRAAEAARGHECSSVNRSARVWIVLMGVALVLGVNKQLDLHTPIFDAMASFVASQGMSSYAWLGQLAVVACILFGTATFIRSLLSRAWSAWSFQGPALLGLGALGLFAATQVAPIGPVNAVVGQVYLGADVGEWLEMTGILLILVSSAAYIRQETKSPRRAAASHVAWEHVRSLIEEHVPECATQPVALHIVHPPDEVGEDDPVLGFVGQ